MLEAITSRFLDPKNPSMGPLLYTLKLFLLWRDGRSCIANIMFHLFYSYCVLYTCSIIVAYSLSSDPDFKTLFLYFVFPLGVFKITTFYLWFEDWKKVLDYFSKVELEAFSEKDDCEHKKVVVKYQGYVHLVVKVFLVAAIGSNLPLLVRLCLSNYLLVPLNYFYSSIPLMLSEFEYKTIVDVVTQSMFMEISAVYEIIWDILVFASMTFILGQLKALKLRCIHALDEEDDEVQFRNIIACHRYHVGLLKHIRLFNSLISPPMFLYLLTIAVNLSLAIVLANKASLSVKLSLIEFVGALMFQLLLFYGLANEIIIQTESMASGIFESNWVSSSMRVRRSVLLLSVGMRQRVALTAGPFNEMSLETYVGILRISYSFYTLLNSTS